MKKILTFVMLFGIISFFSLNVYAQDAAPVPEVTEGQLPIGEEQDPNPPVEETPADTQALQDQNQVFITGIAAGAAIGLVIGAVIAWLLKDKFYKK